MNTPNPNQSLISQVEQLLASVETVEPKDGNTAIAAGGLRTCRDNLRWHGESTLERQAKEAAEKAKKDAASE